ASRSLRFFQHETYGDPGVGYTFEINFYSSFGLILLSAFIIKFFRRKFIPGLDKLYVLIKKRGTLA
ncbi:MAG: hypothetical protein ABIN89_05695, partial [Chitinophagaceae bacterium]